MKFSKDYELEQKDFVYKTRLHAGDLVCVNRKATKAELDYWPDAWTGSMNRYVGLEMKVERIHKYGIRLVSANGIAWNFPYFVVETIRKVGPEVPDEEEI